MGCTLNKIWNKLAGIKEARMMVGGIDSCGKTTLLYFLKTGLFLQSILTIGFSVEVIKIKNFSLQLWDIGSACKIKALVEHILA